VAEKLTPQQQEAVVNRGGRLLVSAAAGSGKTKVLVDRLMHYLLDPTDPANLDDFLIITYTKAAAAELRGKIAAKLTERMALDPENKHLQRQMQRLYMAKISTVHSFCADILKEYAYMLDIPVDFRVADENECRELREICMDKMLDAAYENAAEDADFRAFIDTQGLGRDDRSVPEIILKVYDSARCHLEPETWLAECVRQAEAEEVTDAAQTLWGGYLIRDLHRYLDLQIEGMSACADAAAKAEGMAKPAALLQDTVNQLKRLRESNTWDAVVENSCVEFGRLTISSKCPDQELAERIKAVRSACKKSLEKKLKAFQDDSSIVLEDLTSSAGAVRGIVSLVKRFEAEFDRAKRRLRILDFSDLEQRTLDLLLGRSRSTPTAISREVSRRFREIMVDEYQDSNAVQDAIFMTLTHERQNCFMVGDVKQSIYQFRLADPGIFLDKYARFAPAEVAKEGEGRKVLLTHNFRSSGAVLAGVNDVFAACMSENVGGLTYGEDEALREGIPHVSLGESEVELWAVPVEESTYEEESAFVADRIRRLLDGKHFVRDGESLRPIRPEDICILLRSPGSVGSHFAAALGERGIRCVTGGGEDLLQTMEIRALRAVLQSVSNPRQDIPLVAALTSPVFGFTADDLAVIRAGNRRISIYDALLASKLPKAKAFLETFSVLRRTAQLKTLSELLQEIFLLTRMDSIYAAMDGGENRRNNLLLLYKLASDFESGGHRDLEQFLAHLDAMEEKGLIAAGEQTVSGAVTLMSIHKSKGLEFPVVIVAGLSRTFNREDVRAQVLCDQQLGLGLCAVDAEKRVRYPTIAKRAIISKCISDSLSEEMRVLYVALTRARDRLIMTYASKTLEKDIADIVCRMDVGDRELLTADVVCPGEWVLMSALRRTEAGELFALGGRPMWTTPGEPAWHIAVASNVAVAAGSEAENDPILKMPADVHGRLKESLAFRYPHISATMAPSKQTATQRKGREKDAEISENAPEERLPKRTWRRPDLQKTVCGTAYGTATHAALQYICYENCTDEEAVQAELARLKEQGLITEEQGRMIDSGKIARFFGTEIGQRLRQGGQVLREFKFSILDDGRNFAQELSGEQILLQGVVDCALLEEDGITLIDFKTDFVTEDTLEQTTGYYRPQVKAYADALERIYQKPVKESLLYFFSIERFVKI